MVPLHHLLDQLGDYKLEERREVNVKGKGSMLTYWLGSRIQS